MPEINGKKGGAEAEGAKQWRGFLPLNWSKIFVPTAPLAVISTLEPKAFLLVEAVVPAVPVTVQNQAGKRELSHIFDVSVFL